MTSNVTRGHVIFDICIKNKKAAVGTHSAIRTLPFLFLGWLLISCVCSFNLVFFDQIPQKKTDAASSPEAFTQTRALLETLMGEPYLVATFHSGAEIFLLSPQENDVVTTPWVDVVGTAPAETVITLNEEIAVAGGDGMFYARVPLDEGLNEIQCVASDLEGNEVSFSFVVVFEPEAE